MVLRPPFVLSSPAGRGSLLIALTGLFFALAGCDVTGDGTSGATACSQAAVAQACPAGSVPRLDSASAAQCGGTVEGGYSPIVGADGSVSGTCAAQGECAFACIFETPCRCGIQTLSREGIVCTSPCAACGNGTCEDRESVESCPIDCGGPCTAGEQRCNGTDRQVCNQRGQFETLACPGDNRCREREGGTTECVLESRAVCDEVNRCCDGAFPRNVGEACDDGVFCTATSFCSTNGVCEGGAERDCGADVSVNACQTTVCNEVRSRCEAVSANEGAVCDGGDASGASRCLDGACVVSECECAGVNACCDGCRVRNVGGSCEDGLFCTTGDTCSPNGRCVAGPPRSCQGTTVAACQTAVCDEEVQACVARVNPDLAGTACDDGLFCTVGETCTAAGVCGGGRPRDCAGALTTPECQTGAVCNESQGQCTFVATNLNQPCASPDFCTVNGRCDASGTCAGSPRDCSTEPTDLTCQGPAVCNASLGRCVGPPINEGGACEDGDLCTRNDTCQMGVCTSGAPLACGTATACRAAGTCDPATGSCTSTAQPDGTSCTILNGFGACGDGDCRLTSCRAGFGDCNNDLSDGCEVNLDSGSVVHCGGCGNTCLEPHFLGVCDAGVCPLQEGTTWRYCQQPPRRGDRPVNTATDPNNCGRCGEVCGALSTCAEGLCTPALLEFVRIANGSYTRGSPLNEPDRFSDETQHSVVITRPFLLQVTEVTQAQWQLYMNTDPRLDEAPNRPMANVNWWDAIEFANTVSLAQGLPACYTLSGCTGIPGSTFQCTNWAVNNPTNNPLLCTGYRLPTEGEWEYAYRAGTTTAFYNGAITHTGSTPLDLNLDAIGWYSGNSGDRTQNVARKLPNAWGLYDMAGNVWEWCSDWYGTYPGAVSDPLGPATGSRRVVRGGSFIYGASLARAAYRGFDAPSYRDSFYGFRLSRTAP